MISAARRRARGERGFTVLLTMMVLVFAAGLLAAAIDAVYNDAALTRNDLDQKRAYSAAQAGLAAFTQQLNTNVNYWQSCPGWPSPTTVTVPGSTDNGSTETFSTQIMLATGATTCDVTNPTTSVIELSGAASGTFRVRSIGTSNGVTRTLIAQYARTSFLNFIYYTDYETLDPLTSTPPTTDCTAHYPSRGSDCYTIDFVTGDSVNGPLHSEDTLAICGSPSFGRSSSDQLQAAGFSTEGQNGCSFNPGGPSWATRTTRAPSILPPPSDASLLGIAQSGGYTFTGETTIVLNGATMTVTNANLPGGVETVPFPSNGVVYVSSTSCASTYTPYGPSYASNPSCGNVYVSGNYTSSLTIGSDNDVIINGNITTPTDASGTPTGSALLGLIANDFVRIYHPLSGSRGGPGSCNGTSNATPANGPINTVYAAILAVNHSFIVDNYDCGGSLGTLKVYGAIAQLYRGTVGTFGGNGTTGYFKDYVYDDRLAIAEPPYFLNPVQAAWRIQRQTECAGC